MPSAPRRRASDRNSSQRMHRPMLPPDSAARWCAPPVRGIFQRLRAEASLPRRSRWSAVKSTRAPESSRRVAIAPAPKPAKIGTTVDARLEAAVEDGENLRDHRHAQRHAVAGFRGPARAGRWPRDWLPRCSSAKRDRARGAVLAFPDAGHAIRLRPPVQAIVRDVQPAAGNHCAHSGPRLRVEHLAVWLKPLHAHLAHHFVPEALRHLAREAQKRLAIAKPEALHEAPDVGLFDELARRLPDHATNSLTRAVVR